MSKSHTQQHDHLQSPWNKGRLCWPAPPQAEGNLEYAMKTLLATFSRLW